MPLRAPRITLALCLQPLALGLSTGALARPLAAQQQQDTAYGRLVRQYTTDPRFLAASAATLPASATIPSPKAYFGTIVGAPGVMHHTDEIYGYYRALAKATPRVRVTTVSKSEEGRDILLVLVGNAEDLARVDEYRSGMAKLADPRLTTEDEARRIEGQIKPFYYLNAGLHSPEMGSPEMLMELAYRLAVSEEPTIKAIRDNEIVLMNPASEPDGRDKQVDWYLHYTKGRPTWDDGFPRVTPYWGRYIVHDNNRDGLQISAALTRAIFKGYYDYHPLVLHDLHESVPLLYISTGTGPYNENNDPIIIGEWQTLANNDITNLEAQGLPGVWTWGFFDGWWPGYGAWVANNHNSIGRFFETFGNAGADTYIRDLGNEKFANEPVTTRTWYRPWPPTKKVRWSARDNVNYMEAGVLSSLGFVAANRQRFLHEFWQKGYNSLERGRTQAPYAYVIPGFARQRDPKMVAYLVNQLERQHIEIQKRTSGPDAGDFVILLDQPYRDLAVNLLSLQHFPSTAQYPPYDDIAWTLQDLYGVDVKPVDDTAALHRAGLQPLSDTVAATTQPTGSGSTYLLPYKAQSEVLSALYWLRRTAPSLRVLQATTSFKDAGHDYPAGSLAFEGLTADQAAQLGQRFDLPLVAAAAAPGVATHRIELPRVAIYHTWSDTR
ncbi:MAG TPA: M14 family zinc carboxypeptidase, partial [Longimicrobiales bacterium]